MKIYKTNEEVKADIKDGVLKIVGDVKFECDVDIDANINAHNINAYNIRYYAFCVAYYSFWCKSVKGRRENSFHKCLDSEIVYKKHEITIDGKTIELSEDSFNALKKSLGEL